MIFDILKGINLLLLLVGEFFVMFLSRLFSVKLLGNKLGKKFSLLLLFCLLMIFVFIDVELFCDFLFGVMGLFVFDKDGVIVLDVDVVFLGDFFFLDDVEFILLILVVL